MTCSRFLTGGTSETQFHGTLSYYTEAKGWGECVCPQEDSLTLKKLARHAGAWQPAKMVSGLGFPSSLSTLIMYQIPWECKTPMGSHCSSLGR